MIPPWQERKVPVFTRDQSNIQARKGCLKRRGIFGDSLVLAKSIWKGAAALGYFGGTERGKEKIGPRKKGKS